ncbi:hypothetical protein VB715_21245 [Crocosphaera sp. UHCC 0190]|uniref:hypothetical protein n=1 Tax=Crocosphaera sp. UHCC 0190 TaxID=3110246 RepID=UPI002B21B136|nr:hypothetical protein [Crocosphaera sp. UHCC 0190]MEA5512302.1 hypothetical protein [Crocosphaera sp. UHCC 0190]
MCLLIAEKELDTVARKAGLLDGFEGNAQTFRILTQLEPYKPDFLGLNLTRATLDATLKYPWFREIDEDNKPKNTKKGRKFSVYKLDQEVFKFVRPKEEYRQSGKQSLEASVMEFADDITYSVHDFEDFYLAGLIPLNILLQTPNVLDNFIQDWINSIKNDNEQLKLELEKPEEKKRLKDFLASYLPPEYAPRSINEITYVRANSSLLIQKYLQSASIGESYGEHGYLQRAFYEEIELKLLQRIVWKYVITNPRLATQQYGQRKIIRKLFDIYKEAITNKQNNLIPSRFLQDGSLPEILEEGDENEKKLRLAVDIVASLSESEAVLMYRRLTGLEQGSIMDYIG